MYGVKMAKITLCVVFLILKHADASFFSNCELEGIWWDGGLQLPTINESHMGEIIRYKTNNITAFLGTKNDRYLYLSAKMEGDVLILYTTANFSKFEQEFEPAGDGYVIETQLMFRCSDDREDYINVRQQVVDVNNHSPVFNKKIYEYKLAMDIPKGFELTQLLPINATDIDFSNKMIHFTIDFNQDFRLAYKGVNKGKGVFTTTLTSLKTIKPPYIKNFSITASDNGNPSINSTATVIISVLNNTIIEEEGTTQPVFVDKDNAGNRNCLNILLLLVIVFVSLKYYFI